MNLEEILNLLTAKPFFEQRGYKVIMEQQVIRNEVFLTNYVMEK